MLRPIVRPASSRTISKTENGRRSSGSQLRCGLQHHELPGPGRGRDLRRRQREDVVARRQPRVLQHHGCDVHHHRGKYSCCADQTREPAHGGHGENGGIGGFGGRASHAALVSRRPMRQRENGFPPRPPVTSVDLRDPRVSVPGFDGDAAGKIPRVRYLRMATNAMAVGVLVAMYLAVLVLQLNPQLSILSVAASQWFFALLALYGPYLTVALYFLIVVREFLGSKSLAPAWLSVRLLAWLGAVGAGRGGGHHVGQPAHVPRGAHGRRRRAHAAGRDGDDGGGRAAPGDRDSARVVRQAGQPRHRRAAGRVDGAVGDRAARAPRAGRVVRAAAGAVASRLGRAGAAGAGDPGAARHDGGAAAGRSRCAAARAADPARRRVARLHPAARGGGAAAELRPPARSRRGDRSRDAAADAGRAGLGRGGDGQVRRRRTACGPTRSIASVRTKPNRWTFCPTTASRTRSSSRSSSDRRRSRHALDARPLWQILADYGSPRGSSAGR